MPQEKVTLRSIAAVAGCSPMTVSLALRNAPKIAVETRRRIQDLARTLGYTPDPLVSRLMVHLRGRRRRAAPATLGLLNFLSREKLNNRKVLRFHRGAEARAQQLGYKLDVFHPLDEGLSSARLDRILFTRNIRGLLVGPVYDVVEAFTLPWENYCAVAFEYPIQGLHTHRACNHYYRSMALAARETRKLGYRRIGLCLRTGVDARSDHAWLSAFAYFQTELPAAQRVAPFLHGWDWDARAFGRWLQDKRPDVILTQTEPIRQELKRLGRSIPDDIGFVHLDWVPHMRDLAGIDQKVEEVGAAAVDLVVSKVSVNEQGIPRHPSTLLIEGEWVPGASVRPQA